MPFLRDGDQYGWTFEALGQSDQADSGGVAHREQVWFTRSSASSALLCENCNQLDFSILFTTLINSLSVRYMYEQVYITRGIKLGALSEIKGRRCQFCELISRLSSDPLRRWTTEAENVEVWLNNIDPRHQNGGPEARVRGQKRVPGRTQLEISLRNSDGEEYVFRIQNVSKAAPILGSFMPTETNPQMTAKSWPLLKLIDACEKVTTTSNSHPENGHSLVDIYDGLVLCSRVVDIRRRRIVDAPKGCRYVALSYVWGEQRFFQLNSTNYEALEEDGSLNFEGLPHTIRDTITLCRGLGERYLWIDSMCIIQDSINKHNELKYMESIYRGAFLTVVAANGSHAGTGLPGFSGGLFKYNQDMSQFQQQARESSTRRKSYQRPEKFILSGLPPSFEGSVDRSTWNSRAWTYQERLLSQRLLIFTNEQVYFQCNHGRTSCDSDIDPHGPNSLKQLEDTEVADDPYRIQLKKAVNLNIYAKMVREYTSRRLIYKSDIENAFGGISKIISVLFGSSEVVYGIPTAGLALGLLWRAESPGSLQRRQPDEEIIDMTTPWSTPSWPLIEEWGSQKVAKGVFPSWSWVGWVGKVEYPDLKSLSERNISKIEWLDPLNKLEQLPNEWFGRESPEWSSNDRWIRQVMPDYQIYYTQRGSDGQHWFCHPMEPFIHNPIPIDRDRGLLHIRTSTATFNVAPYQGVRSGACQYWLRDSQDRAAGVIALDGSWEAVSGRSRSSSHFHENSNHPDRPSLYLRGRSRQTVTTAVVSQTTLKEGNTDPAWTPTLSGYYGTPGSPSQNDGIDTRGAEALFDKDVYPANICWCLYNVLVLNEGKRIGIGKIHIQAFKNARPVKKVLTLS
jgi:hypothetical protein